LSYNVFFLTLLPCGAADYANATYLDTLVEQALQKKLHEKRFWHLLVHYGPTLFGGYESEEDAASFFNARNGKWDPKAEMVATIQSFFKKPEDLQAKEEHPQCNFPARYKWLKSAIPIDETKLPKADCRRLDGWMSDLDPERITLVFASFYMNNPASMFGHTLLRVDKKRESGSGNLLDYGINYSVVQDSTNPLVYSFKGLFGLSPGVFSIFPYYTKVQEYSNWESRDIWEYELDFNPEQMEYMLLHLWELGGNYFDYYYFQENCAYHLLALLEIADPTLRLREQFTFSVIPTDTIKAVMNVEGLVSRVVYRPSLLSQMKNKILWMSKEQKTVFSLLTKDFNFIQDARFQSMTVPEKALVLDAYLDYAQNKKMRASDDEKVFSKNMRKALLKRSSLKYIRKESQVTRFSEPPELSHGSSQFRMGVGIFENEAFQQLSFRPAYHDLLAKDTGYSKGSQILFFDLNLRYYNDRKKVKVDRFKLVDIISLSPYDTALKNRSWRLNFGIDTIKDLDCNLCNSFKLNYGMGLTYQHSFNSPMLLYAFLDAEAEAASGLGNKYRIGGGPAVGLLLSITDSWKFQAAADYRYFPLGFKSEYVELEANQSYTIVKDLDIRIKFNSSAWNEEWLFSVNYFF